MQNFEFHNPTKIYFGKGQISNLKDIIKTYGNKVLLVYGGGSIKKIGLYDEVIKELEGLEVFELANVKPNPRIESVYEGVKLCLAHDIDVILAVGGGSIIDCSKAIAAARYYDEDAWHMVKNAKLITKALPIVTILTVAATSSEMNPTSVISNLNTNEKRGFAHPLLYPKASILDPTYTFTVSKYHTAAGVADIMSHIIEQYFNDNNAYFPREMCHAVLKTCIKYGPIALNEPNNYEARSNIMWAATFGLNGVVDSGLGEGWSCHAIEHALSAYFDVTHGTGLAIITPAWMEYILNDKTVDCFYKYGVGVWNINPTLDKYEVAKLAIAKTKEFFFKTMEIPSTLKEIGIDSKYEEMALEAANSKGGTIKGYVHLDKDDVLKIFELCK